MFKADQAQILIYKTMLSYDVNCELYYLRHLNFSHKTYMVWAIHNKKTIQQLQISLQDSFHRKTNTNK